GFKGLLLGSVSNHCLHHAPCPVAVIRHGAQVDGSDGADAGPERVVVGVDGSPVAQRALRWAIDEARARGARLDVVHAWSAPVVGGPFAIVAFEPTLAEQAANEIVDRALAAEDTTGVDVQRGVTCGAAAPALLAAAQGAGLVVVGSRGRGGFQRLLLGSVSQQVAQHAPGPVVVVPPDGR
ncbi:MAG TPA: universal stress protein, partial [Acidimicrobiales bacterium]